MVLRLNHCHNWFPLIVSIGLSSWLLGFMQSIEKNISIENSLSIINVIFPQIPNHVTTTTSKDKIRRQ
ncbi:hypothetical protein GM3709_117 [Geminocystis sp. NIES-3709]|nr:hypothetical protein GM3709_117 [Geminocystis sp. NIES-3709]